MQTYELLLVHPLQSQKRSLQAGDSLLHKDLVPGSRRDPIPRQVGIAHNKNIVLIRGLAQHVLYTNSVLWA